jgi:hypothetical protein
MEELGGITLGKELKSMTPRSSNVIGREKRAMPLAFYPFPRSLFDSPRLAFFEADLAKLAASLSVSPWRKVHDGLADSPPVPCRYPLEHPLGPYSDSFRAAPSKNSVASRSRSSSEHQRGTTCLKSAYSCPPRRARAGSKEACRLVPLRAAQPNDPPLSPLSHFESQQKCGL